MPLAPEGRKDLFFVSANAEKADIWPVSRLRSYVEALANIARFMGFPFSMHLVFMMLGKIQELAYMFI